MGTGDTDKPQTAAEMRDALAVVFIGRCEKLYEASGRKNPVHALKAFMVARRLHLAPPAWVLEYLEGSISSLLSVKAFSPEAVSDAFGFGTRRGGRAELRAAAKDDRDLGLINLVDHFKTTDPSTLTPELKKDLELNGPFWAAGQRVTPTLEAETVREIYYDRFRE